jgi:hypothetical protein
MQRTIDQLRGDKSSLERKLQDAKAELKAIDHINQQIQPSLTHKSSSNRIDDDDDNSNLEQTLSNNKTTFHDDDDDEGLSDTDSDMIEMKQTLNELKHMSFLPLSTISMNNYNEKSLPKSTTIDLAALSNHDVSSATRNISFERTSNSSLIDSGRWSNTISSKIVNSTYPIGMQTLHRHQPSVSKTNYWQSQSSLITREAVIKAARDVLPPGVIDHLTSTH